MHFSFQRHSSLIGILRDRDVFNFDLSHDINVFQFEQGASSEALAVKRKFKDYSQLNSLQGMKVRSLKENGTFVYYMNIIRTVYNDKEENYTLNQYTLSKYESATMVNDIPGVIVKYDIAPIYVYYRIRENSTIHFFIRIISIIGGVITVAGVIASFLHTSPHKLVSALEH